MLLAYALCYMPTLALSNSLSFHQMSDPASEFPSIRVLGTIGWIVAGLAGRDDGARGHGGAHAASPRALPSLLGLFCLALPHTPPTRGRRA